MPSPARQPVEKQIAKVTLTRTTDKVTDRFNLQAEVTILHLTYNGTSYFIVTLKDYWVSRWTFTPTRSAIMSVRSR